jgi:hypothetical protein
MTSEEAVQYELVAEGLDEPVGLWEFCHAAEHSLGLSPSETRTFVLTLVRSILSKALMRPGEIDVGNWEFTRWRLSADEAVGLISKRWDDLGRRPQSGDIAYFTTTDDGSSWVQSREAAYLADHRSQK